MTRDRPSRRLFLTRGLAGVTAAVAGCAGVDLGDGPDPAEDAGTDEPADDPGSGTGWPTLLSRVPRSVQPGDHPPVVVASPGRVDEFRVRLPDRVVSLFEDLSTAGGLLPFGLADVSAVAATHGSTLVAASYDREALAETLLDADFREHGEEAMTYISPTGFVAVTMQDGWLSVGYHTGGDGAVPTAEAAVAAAGRADAGWTSGRGEAVASALSDADYALVQPVAGAPETAPEAGLFRSELAYGVGVTLDEDETTLRYRRRFEEPPERAAIDRWVEAAGDTGWPAEPTVAIEGRTTTVSGTVQTGDLNLFHLGGAVRNAAGREMARDPPSVVETEDRYDVYAAAFQFGYQPFSTDAPTFEQGRRVVFHITSLDLVHGFALPVAGVRRLVVPGEVTTADLLLRDARTHEVVCSHYCGAGHEQMRGRFEVTGDGTAGVPSWVEGANGFDGSLTDRRGSSDVRVRVGAEVDDGPYAFDPAGVRIDPGTTVTFEWVSDDHTVSVESQPSVADWRGHDPVEEAGYTYEHTFEADGVYAYYCKPHRSLGMKGAVVVGRP